MEPEISPNSKLINAALAAFAEAGFQATTTRDIARRAEVSPAGLYVHFQSKAEILYRVSVLGHDGVLQVLQVAASEDKTSVERFHGIVAAFVAWHAENNRLAKVVQYEIRSLEDEAFRDIAERRRRIEMLMRHEIAQVCASQNVPVHDLRTTGRAVLSLGIDVARWYTSRDRDLVDPIELGDRYGDLACHMLQLPVPDRTPPSDS